MKISDSHLSYSSYVKGTFRESQKHLTTAELYQQAMITLQEMAVFNSLLKSIVHSKQSDFKQSIE